MGNNGLVDDFEHTGSASTTDHQAELDTLLDIFLATDLMWNVRF
jgi:hypothetical protein